MIKQEPPLEQNPLSRSAPPERDSLLEFALRLFDAGYHLVGVTHEGGAIDLFAPDRSAFLERWSGVLRAGGLHALGIVPYDCVWVVPQTKDAYQALLRAPETHKVTRSHPVAQPKRAPKAPLQLLRSDGEMLFLYRARPREMHTECGIIVVGQHRYQFSCVSPAFCCREIAMDNESAFPRLKDLPYLPDNISSVLIPRIVKNERMSNGLEHKQRATLLPLLIHGVIEEHEEQIARYGRSIPSGNRVAQITRYNLTEELCWVVEAELGGQWRCELLKSRGEHEMKVQSTAGELLFSFGRPTRLLVADERYNEAPKEIVLKQGDTLRFGTPMSLTLPVDGDTAEDRYILLRFIPKKS